MAVRQTASDNSGVAVAAGGGRRAGGGGGGGGRRAGGGAGGGLRAGGGGLLSWAGVPGLSWPGSTYVPWSCQRYSVVLIISRPLLSIRVAFTSRSTERSMVSLSRV